MKLLFFAGGSYLGGMEMVTMHLMEALRRNGHDARAVVSGWNDGVYPQMLREREIPFHELKLGRLYLSKPWWTLNSVTHLPKGVLALRRVLSEMQPDVIVMPDLNQAITVLPFIPRCFPVVFYLHDVPPYNLFDGCKKGLRPRFSGAVAVSDFIGKLLRKSAPGFPVSVVHNGLPEHGRHASSDYSRSHLRIGIVGQVIPRKRHGLLVHVARILAHRSKIEFHILIFADSDTPYARQIKDEIDWMGLARYFEWCGFERDHLKLYSSIDVLVAPAVNEPFGTTVLEAQSFGIPVVVSRSGGFPEMVDDGVTGFLVDPHEPEQFAERLIEMEDVEKRRAMGERGREWVRQRFTAKRMAENFVRACGVLLDGQHGQE